MAKWRVAGTEPRADGSGAIAFDVFGLDDGGNVIPGRHTTVQVGADAVAAALAQPTNPLRNAALKAALEAPLLALGWENDALDADVAANLAASLADADLDAYVATLTGYPVDFQL